jgi:hypothetical protein
MADTDAAVLVELAALDALAYERLRRRAAKRLRCRLPVLDGLVQDARRQARREAAEATWRKMMAGQP